MDLIREIAGITDVKCDCTLQELTGHINILATHFGGNFSEEDVMAALRELEEDDESDVLVVRTNPGTGYPIDKCYPWCVVRTRPRHKFVPIGYDDVPG
jgi:hypothetical protein